MNQSEIERAIRHNYVVEYVSGNGRIRCHIKRRSEKTSNLSITLIESRGGYVMGARLHVAPYEIEEKQSRPEELQSQLINAYLRTTTDLQEMIDDGRRAREKFAKAILAEDAFESLTDQVRWGNGVKADIKAAYAYQILETAKETERDLKDVLLYVGNACTRDLLGHSFSFSSSSAFSNAVEQERADACREIREFCIRHAERLVEVCAEMEVL